MRHLMLDLESPGAAHDALDDARSQASTLINIINWANGTHYEQRIAT